jgi:hypothetical protein
MGKDVCSLCESMFDDKSALIKGFKISMALGIMGDIIDEDNVSFVKGAREDLMIESGF